MAICGFEIDSSGKKRRALIMAVLNPTPRSGYVCSVVRRV